MLGYADTTADPPYAGPPTRFCPRPTPARRPVSAPALRRPADPFPPPAFGNGGRLFGEGLIVVYSVELHRCRDVLYQRRV
jgi:hypothetical protein